MLFLQDARDALSVISGEHAMQDEDLFKLSVNA
jgi:hypothetical protein